MTAALHASDSFLSMQHPSPALPANVWSVVATFLPPEEVKYLYGVNKAFFDLSMNERYWRVSFNGDKRTMKWLRKNIVKDPVRSYVRTVEIKPWKIEERAVKQQSIWWSLFRLLTRKNDEWTKKAEEHRKQQKVAKAIKRISDAVKALPNVREYTVQCSEDNCNLGLVHGLLPSLTNWKHSLVKLTLCVPPDSLLCLAAVTLNRLENLELVFWTKAPERFQYQVIEPLEVFINNLYPTLESLSVVATREATDVDLAPLFNAFGTFPQLTHFDLSMPFDGSSFSTTQPLLSFVTKHTGLRSLGLSTKPSPTGRRLPTQEEHREWIPRILNLLDGSFRDIQKVNVALRPLKAKVTFDAVFRFLSIHGCNLTSLALTEDAGLSPEEVQAILGTTKFYHVERLEFNVHRPSEELFTLLAQRFPRLEHFGVGFMYPPLSLHSLWEGLNNNREFYLDWGLKRIHISCTCCPGPMEALLKDCIPSLEDVACSTN